MLDVGKHIGQIIKDSTGIWMLYEDEINKITKNSTAVCQPALALLHNK